MLENICKGARSAGIILRNHPLESILLTAAFCGAMLFGPGCNSSKPSGDATPVQSYTQMSPAKIQKIFNAYEIVKKGVDTYDSEARRDRSVNGVYLLAESQIKMSREILAKYAHNSRLGDDTATEHAVIGYNLMVQVLLGIPELVPSTKPYFFENF